MGRISYTITSGELPITVNLIPQGVENPLVRTNIHSEFGSYSFEGIDISNYVIEFVDSLFCYASENITPCLDCPDGFTPVGLNCIKYDEVEPNYTSAYTVVKKEANPAYSVNGAVIFDSGWNYNGTGSHERIMPQTNTYWANTPYPSYKGVMNRTAVWANVTKNQQHIGFSFCVDIAVAKTYYVGFGCDNWGKIKLNGQFILEQNRAALMSMFGSSDLGIPHKYWFIYPVEFPAGRNVIEVLGYNSESVAGVGIQIYNATKNDLINATIQNPLAGDKILFSSEQLVGGELPYEYTVADGFHGYECPDGYALNACDGPPKCVKQVIIPCGTEYGVGFKFTL